MARKFCEPAALDKPAPRLAFFVFILLAAAVYLHCENTQHFELTNDAVATTWALTPQVSGNMTAMPAADDQSAVCAATQRVA
jgi:multidrug resistance efflux pump